MTLPAMGMKARHQRLSQRHQTRPFRRQPRVDHPSAHDCKYIPFYQRPPSPPFPRHNFLNLHYASLISVLGRCVYCLLFMILPCHRPPRLCLTCRRHLSFLSFFRLILFLANFPHASLPPSIRSLSVQEIWFLRDCEEVQKGEGALIRFGKEFSRVE